MSYKLSDFRKKIQEEKKLLTYDDLAFLYGVNKYYFWCILNKENYYPPARVCVKLGLPALAPAPVCLKCGEVHTAKRCPKTQKPRAPRSPWLISEEEMNERLAFVMRIA